MSVSGVQFVALIAAACVAVIAAICDLKWHRIPNALTLPAIILGITIHTIRSGLDGLTFSLWGIAIGGGALLVFYILGGMGAGDVKLMGGIGALTGGKLVLSVLALTGIAGGIMAMGKLTVRYAKRYRVDRGDNPTGTQAGALAGEVRDGLQAGGNPMKETMPYGIAIAAGTVLSVVLVILLAGGSS